MARSLLSDLRLGFSAGALVLGLAMGAFTDLTLRHSMATEDGLVARSEGRVILRQLEARAEAPPLGPGPESTLIDWRLLTPDGKLLMESAGSRFLGTLDWGKVGTEPVEFRVDANHLYSAVVLPSSIGTLRVAMDRSNELEVLFHFRRDLVAALLLLSVLSAVVGHVIARRGLRPLEKIRDETSRIEAQDLHRRLDASRFPEELASLVAALNGALARLETAFSRLEAFSSDLAHELRTPIQNLRAELEGCILRPRADADVPEVLGSLLEELDRLDQMVEQMLFLARNSVPGAALDCQALTAAALLRESAAFFGAAAEEAGVKIETQAPSGLLIYADQRLVHRALQNLLANAIRHTPPGGGILVSARTSDRATEISVADTGDGMPAALLPHLGDRFLRLEEEGRGRTTGGAGLGLAIVKGITALHGGSFLVESSLGAGTTVRLRFPDAN
ncbi:MAG TPA: heavy metal sensor histidine kinase [Holophagaceae bacterium]|nr:heavy metal sensor histidine kinase [Holophagaceae bacterium]